MTKRMLALVSVLAIAIPTFAQGPFTSLIFGGAARSGAGLLGRGLFAEAAAAEVAAAEGMAARGAMRSFSGLGRGWLAAEEGVIAAESRALAHPMSRGLFRSGGTRWGSTALAAEEGFLATESRLATRGAMRGMGRGWLAAEEGVIAAETRVLAHPMARTGGSLFRRGGSGGLLSAEAEAAVAAETRIASHPMARSGSQGFLASETEVVQRAMTRAELEATQRTGFLRGGRVGTASEPHYVSDSVNTSLTRARQRLALPKEPEVRVTMEVPKGIFSSPSQVKPFELKPGQVLPGGGLERTAVGEVPVKILNVQPLK